MNQDQQNEVQQSQSPSRRVPIQPQLNPGVASGGTARQGISGTPCDLVHLVASESAYFLRVPLPGVSHDNCKVRVNVRVDGQVYVEGLVTDCEILKEAVQTYQVKVQDPVKPGHFCVSLKLPEPVNPRLTTLDFKPNGILEVVFRKVKQPHLLLGSPWFPHPR